MSRYIGGQIGDVQEPNNRYSPGELKGVFSASDQYQMRKGGGWAGVKGMQCEGGDAVNDYIEGTDVYRAHIFLRDGKFKVLSIGEYGDEIEYLVVAGGGGGGGAATTPGAGGGGGGGVRIKLSGSPMNNPAAQEVFVAGKASGTQRGDGFGTYTVRVGRGGRSSPGSPPSNSNSNRNAVGTGQPSYFGPPRTPEGLTATGGGGGGVSYLPSFPGMPNPQRAEIFYGGPGGSGGGGGGDVGQAPGGTGNTPPTSPPQGSNGGAGTDAGGADSGGGGGGATQPGSSVTSQQIGADGGNGLTSVNMAPGFRTSFGGGGGGGSSQNQSSAGSGGNGGGGSGSYQPTANAAIGERFSGGGGGGRSNGYNGKEGGSGCVIVRYKIGTYNLPGNVKASGGIIAVYAPDDASPQRGKVVHTFVYSGSFVANQNIQNMECLIIGGGGGGGSAEGYAGPAGGGGAGAVIYKTGRSVTAGSHTVTVGNGGEPSYLGGDGGPDSQGSGYKGGDSVFNGLTATGGGYGGGYNQQGGTSGSAGGSGNGNTNTPAVATANPGSVVVADEVSPDNGWGYPGGAAASYSPGTAQGSGGGGGAAGAGSAGGNSNAGSGGDGVAYTIVGQGVKWYAGGGGGTWQSAAGPGGKGGPGSDNPLGGDGGVSGKAGNYGGGTPYVPQYGMGQDGQMTTGSGGGGGMILNPGYSWLATGGAGGPGIVVIAYPSD